MKKLKSWDQIEKEIIQENIRWGAAVIAKRNIFSTLENLKKDLKSLYQNIDQTYSEKIQNKLDDFISEINFATKDQR